MGLLTGKKGLIFGLANERSIAWGISRSCAREGAELGFTYLNDALKKRVEPLAAELKSVVFGQCDVQSDIEIARVAQDVKDSWGKIDFIVHSVAFASADDLKVPFSQTSRDGFRLALDVSVYSLIALCRELTPLMVDGGSIITLSYLGAEKVVPNYRVMGVAKAALEASVRELAADLGKKNIRVSGISAGPIKTLAAAGLSDFKSMLNICEERSPLKRNVTTEEVGDTAVYLLSDLSRAVTGGITYVDSGFNITAL